jgi:DNA polymerase I-like protein with 3'-5' exonuclease and polymerase domains
MPTITIVNIKEAPIQDELKIINLMRNIMVSVVKLSVPVRVSVKTGPNWGSLCPYREIIE